MLSFMTRNRHAKPNRLVRISGKLYHAKRLCTLCWGRGTVKSPDFSRDIPCSCLKAF